MSVLDCDITCKGFFAYCMGTTCEYVTFAGEAEACQVAAAQSGPHSSEGAAGQPESLAGCGSPQAPEGGGPHAPAVKASAQPQAACLPQVPFPLSLSHTEQPTSSRGSTHCKAALLACCLTPHAKPCAPVQAVSHHQPLEASGAPGCCVTMQMVQPAL